MDILSYCIVERVSHTWPAQEIISELQEMPRWWELFGLQTSALEHQPEGSTTKTWEKYGKISKTHPEASKSRRLSVVFSISAAHGRGGLSTHQ